MKGKKAQHILYSMMFMLFLFFLIVTLFINYLYVNPSPSADTYKLVESDALRAADALLRSGYPHDWQMNSVYRIGIVDNGYINKTKVDNWHANVSLSRQNYDKSKGLLGIQNEYMILIEEIPGQDNLPDVIPGNDLVGQPNSIDDVKNVINPELIATQERIALYNTGTKTYPVKINIIIFRGYS